MAQLRIFAAAAVAALLSVEAAGAASLTGSSPGFHYFYKQGATMAEHDAALVDCAVRTRALVNGSDAAGNAANYGLFGALIGGVIDSNENRQGAAANTENCMALKGWSVVGLTQAEGEAMEQPDDPAAIHAKLVPLVTSPRPRGPLLRGPFANELAVGNFKVEKARDLEEVSISVRALKGLADAAVAAAGELKPRKPDLPKGVKAPKPGKAMKAAELVAAGPARSHVAMRTFGDAQTQNAAAVTLVRLERDGTEIDYDGKVVEVSFGYGYRRTGKGESDLGKHSDYVAEVPPGLWKMAEISHIPFTADLCFGAPAFEVKAGETIFLGAVKMGNVGGYPISPDLVVARQILAANPALAEKVKPAEWINGYTSDCFGSYAYAYEVPGAPFVDMKTLARSGEQPAAPPTSPAAPGEASDVPAEQPAPETSETPEAAAAPPGAD